MNKPNFSWIPFYEELADIILTYKDNRTSLVEKVKLAHKEANKNLPRIEKDNEIIPDIDPFTVLHYLIVESKATKHELHFVLVIKKLLGLHQMYRLILMAYLCSTIINIVSTVM